MSIVIRIKSKLDIISVVTEIESLICNILSDKNKHVGASITELY